MSLRNFKIDDVPAFIKMIEERPVLWKRKGDYRMTTAADRKTAFSEVAEILDQHFEARSAEDQDAIVRIITQKWSNIRDSFLKSIRKRILNETCKPYLYSNVLQFLFHEDASFAAESEDPLDEFDGNEFPTTPKLIPRRSLLESTHYAGSSGNDDYCDDTDAIPTKRIKETISNEVAQAVRSRLQLDEMEAFFISITPYANSLNMEQKMAFKLEVLRLLQKVKKQNSPNVGIKNEVLDDDDDDVALDVNSL